MRRRVQQITSSIVQALTHYFLAKDADNINIRIEREASDIAVSIQGNVDISETEYTQLREALGQPNLPDIEHYYSELLDSGDQADLSILGSLVDEERLSYSGGLLEIYVRKGFQDTGR